MDARGDERVGAKALSKKRSVYVYIHSLAHLCRHFLRTFLRRALAFSSLIQANALLFLLLRYFARTVQYYSHKTIRLSREVLRTMLLPGYQV